LAGTVAVVVGLGGVVEVADADDGEVDDEVDDEVDEEEQALRLRLSRPAPASAASRRR